MRSRRILTLCLFGLATFFLDACSSAKPADPVEPAFNLQLFSASSSRVDNPYLPLVPNTSHIYRVETEDEIEIIVVEVLETTRMVNGVACAIVRDRAFVEELLIEDTFDWYAQDINGNVWYMGEEVDNFEYDDDGNLIGTDHEGSWEAGVDGAVAGFVMKATLRPGDSYRQEYYQGEAEDMGEIVALNVPVTLEDETTYSCLKTREWTPLEPGVEEFKYFAPGVGLVLVEHTDVQERGELKGIFETGPGSLSDLSAATFSSPAQITNNFLRFQPGDVFEYENETEDGLEEILVEVLATTRTVAGIECAVVRDRVYLDGLLIEDTHDWYAQDDDGNVWYMGEDVDNFEYDEDGNQTGLDHDGAWETEVDGAEAGIIMWASPAVGDSYRQEFYEDEAEDMAVVVATGVTVRLTDGTTYTGCLQNLEWSPLDPGVIEYKFYRPGLGVVLEHPLISDELVELVSGP